MVHTTCIPRTFSHSGWRLSHTTPCLSTHNWHVLLLPASHILIRSLSNYVLYHSQHSLKVIIIWSWPKFCWPSMSAYGYGRRGPSPRGMFFSHTQCAEGTTEHRIRTPLRWKMRREEEGGLRHNFFEVLRRKHVGYTRRKPGKDHWYQDAWHLPSLPGWTITLISQKKSSKSWNQITRCIANRKSENKTKHHTTWSTQTSECSRTEILCAASGYSGLPRSIWSHTMNDEWVGWMRTWYLFMCCIACLRPDCGVTLVFQWITEDWWWCQFARFLTFHRSLSSFSEPQQKRQEEPNPRIQNRRGKLQEKHYEKEWSRSSPQGEKTGRWRRREGKVGSPWRWFTRPLDRYTVGADHWPPFTVPPLCFRYLQRLNLELVPERETYNLRNGLWTAQVLPPGMIYAIRNWNSFHKLNIVKSLFLANLSNYEPPLPPVFLGYAMQTMISTITIFLRQQHRFKDAGGVFV